MHVPAAARPLRQRLPISALIVVMVLLTAIVLSGASAFAGKGPTKQPPGRGKTTTTTSTTPTSTSPTTTTSSSPTTTSSTSSTTSSTTIDSTSTTTSTTASIPELKVPAARLGADGALIKNRDGAGSRVVFKGVNLPYANPAQWPEMTDAMYTNRVAVFDRMAELGVNTVRFALHHAHYEAADDPLDRRNEGYTKAEQIDRAVDLINEATSRGMYVWIESHGLQSRTTSYVEANYRDAWPMLDAILEHPAVVDNEFVLLNAMNEPGDGSTTWADLDRWYRAYIDHYRNDIGYDRMIIFDGQGWSHNLNNEAALDAIEAYDAAQGHVGKIAWSHHRYPGPTSKPDFYTADYDSYMRSVGVAITNGHAVVVGEWGEIDSGATPQRRWFNEFADFLARTEIPRGHNGGAAWAWSWDPNNLTSAWTAGQPVNATTMTTLSSMGNDWKRFYLDPLSAL